MLRRSGTQLDSDPQLVSLLGCEGPIKNSGFIFICVCVCVWARPSVELNKCFWIIVNIPCLHIRVKSCFVSSFTVNKSSQKCSQSVSVPSCIGPAWFGSGFRRGFIPSNRTIVAGMSWAGPLDCIRAGKVGGRVVVGRCNFTAAGSRVNPVRPDVPRAWIPNNRNRVVT